MSYHDQVWTISEIRGCSTLGYLLVLSFSHYVGSDSLQPHELQHARIPYPSISPGVCSNSCPSSQQCHPTILSSVVPLFLLPSIFPSPRVFSNELGFWFRWPNYWSLSFSISPSNEYLGLISFWIDWFDFLAVHGTLKESSSAPQFKSINSWHLAFFKVKLSHPYMTTGKNIGLTIWAFVSKMMSLPF